eukprot:1774136-Rhodomonas_salina.1
MLFCCVCRAGVTWWAVKERRRLRPSSRFWRTFCSEFVNDKRRLSPWPIDECKVESLASIDEITESMRICETLSAWGTAHESHSPRQPKGISSWRLLREKEGAYNRLDLLSVEEEERRGEKRAARAHVEDHRAFAREREDLLLRELLRRGRRAALERCELAEHAEDAHADAGQGLACRERLRVAG